MRWHSSLLVLSVLGYMTNGVRSTAQLNENYIEDLPLDEENMDFNLYDDQLEKASSLLAKLLILPWPHGISPILYVENNPQPEREELFLDNPELDDTIHPVSPKRSRYYRKYPWKRQNSRYEPGNRFICNPSKDDVFRLLVALHEARQGNRDRVVNFCNRKRPAHSIFTNIRFPGK